MVNRFQVQWLPDFTHQCRSQGPDPQFRIFVFTGDLRQLLEVFRRYRLPHHFERFLNHMTVVQQPLFTAGPLFSRFYTGGQLPVYRLKVGFQVSQIGFERELLALTDQVAMALRKGRYFFRAILEMLVRVFRDRCWLMPRRFLGWCSARKKLARTTDSIGISASQFHCWAELSLESVG